MTDKKKSQKPEEDELTLKLPNLYKRKCEANGLTQCKTIRDRIDKAIEDGKLESLQMWDETGPIQIRALMECFHDLSYPHLKKIRLWKIDLQNEGLRGICNFVDKTSTLQYLDLMDNNISSLGCEFLSKILKNEKNNIIKLKLDNNPIGDEGLHNLSFGLRQNSKIEKLSFNFCGITGQSVKYIQEVLANINCKLRTLKMMGNPLGNEGAYELLRAVASCGEHLEKLNMADVQMNILNYQEDIGITIEEKIQKELLSIVKNNSSIAKYNFRNNWIPDEILRKMLNEVRDNKVIFIIDLPENMTHGLKQMQAEIMKKRKPKKKKKGKSGKAKNIKKK